MLKVQIPSIQEQSQKIQESQPLGSNDERQKQGQSGKWTIEENLKYTIFLDFNKNKLSSKKKRRSCRMFQQMSNFIGSRTSIQCRSHHQKLDNKFKNIKGIIKSIKLTIGKQEYKRKLKKFRPILNNLQLENKVSLPKNNQEQFKSEQNHPPTTNQQPNIQNNPILNFGYCFNPLLFNTYLNSYYSGFNGFYGY